MKSTPLKEKPYQAPSITLLQAIKNVAGNLIEKISLQMINHQQHSEIIDQRNAQDSLDDKQTTTAIYRDLIKLGTGLTEAELQQLILPDYNSLLALVDEHYGNSTEHWLGKEALSDVHALPLLVPIETSEGAFSCLTLTFPTLANLDMMEKQPQAQQDLFIKTCCTGLGTQALQQLSVPDWKMLDAKVNDFLYQSGDFFLNGQTANSSLTTSS